MPSARYVPVAEDRIGTKLGPAWRLEEFLVANQTDAAGRVYYGKPVNYSWILARWPGNPDQRPGERTLKRWMCRLRDLGRVRVRLERFNAAMTIVMLASVKFSAADAPAEQLRLLGAPVKFPVQKQRKTLAPRGAKSGPSVGPKVAPERSMKKANETIKTYAQNSREFSTPSPARRYAQTGQLVADAQRILERDAANGREQSFSDVKEELKLIAASKAFGYDGQMIGNAIEIAQRRLRARAG